MASASSEPARKGTMMLACEMATVAWPRRRTSAGSSSTPTRNMKRMTPTCESWPRNGATVLGTMKLAAAGARRPSSDGPSAIPATISPITGGWWKKANALPRPRARRMTAHSASRRCSSVSTWVSATCGVKPPSPTGATSREPAARMSSHAPAASATPSDHQRAAATFSRAFTRRSITASGAGAGAGAFSGEEGDQVETAGGDGGGGGDGEEPGPDDARGDAPLDAGQLGGRRADADDRAGDGVRRRDRDAGEGGEEEGEGAGGLRAEAADRLEARDLHPHRLDDPPAAERGADAHRQVAGEDDPEGARVEDGDVDVLLHHAAGDQDGDDDAHRLLRVVAAVAERVERGGEQLPAAEAAVDDGGAPATEQPVQRQHHREADAEADQRGEDDELGGLDQLRPAQRVPPGVRDAGAGEA